MRTCSTAAHHRKWNVCIALWLIALCHQPSALARQSSSPVLYGVRVVAQYPHDTAAFTEGLQFDRLCVNGSNGSNCTDVFWESTGLNGQSSMRLVELKSGNILKSVPVDAQWFAEGTVRLDDRVYQLTYLTNQGFIYSAPDLKQIGRFKTPLRDGWGMTTNGKYLIISDGSENITWLSPEKNFTRIKSIAVTYDGMRITNLNELEWIRGEIWANIWMTECIARIDRLTGQVTSWMLLHGLRDSMAQENQFLDVLNGIAWDKAGNRLFVTGKYWPKVLQVEVVPLAANNTANQNLLQSCLYSAVPL